MNIQAMMKQAQQMQKKMQTAQAEFETQEIEGGSGNGAVKVVMSGKRQLTKLTIDGNVIDPSDKEMLEDLVLTAVNDALSKTETAFNQAMSGVMPAGMKLPF